MSAAKHLHTDLFVENWTSTSKNSNADSFISYLMVEEVEPPDYVWSKICNELDNPLKSNKMNHSTATFSKSTTIAILITGSIVVVSAMLFFLI